MVGKVWYKFCHIVAGWTCRTAWERKSEKKSEKSFSWALTSWTGCGRVGSPATAGRRTPRDLGYNQGREEDTTPPPGGGGGSARHKGERVPLGWHEPGRVETCGGFLLT